MDQGAERPVTHWEALMRVACSWEFPVSDFQSARESAGVAGWDLLGSVSFEGVASKLVTVMHVV